MNLQVEKYELAKFLFNTEDEGLIAKIKDIITEYRSKSDWIGVTDAEIKSIEAGLEDVEAGRVLSREEVRNQALRILKSGDND